MRLKLERVDVHQVVLVDVELGDQQENHERDQNRHHGGEEDREVEEAHGDAGLVAEVVEPVLELRLAVVLDDFLEGPDEFGEVHEDLVHEAEQHDLREVAQVEGLEAEEVGEQLAHVRPGHLSRYQGVEQEVGDEGAENEVEGQHEVELAQERGLLDRLALVVLQLGQLKYYQRGSVKREQCNQEWAEILNDQHNSFVISESPLVKKHSNKNDAKTRGHVDNRYEALASSIFLNHFNIGPYDIRRWIGLIYNPVFNVKFIIPPITH